MGEEEVRLIKCGRKTGFLSLQEEGRGGLRALCRSLEGMALFLSSFCAILKRDPFSWSLTEAELCFVSTI